jgi:tRNA threonylcarbamoyladenosine biosynthesis protein TsaE
VTAPTGDASQPRASLTLEISDPEATVAFGRRLGQSLYPGAVIALIGPLGAGKTYLVRAIAEGLGIADSRAVSSPTFVLIQEYEARLPVYHFDTYRLNGPAEFAGLGVQEYFADNGVCLIEWADRVEAALPPDYLRVAIEVTGETARRLSITARGPRAAALLANVRPG